jgi:hypothetical protein
MNWDLAPVVLAKTERIMVQGQPKQNIQEILSPPIAEYNGMHLSFKLFGKLRSGGSSEKMLELRPG